MNMIRISTLQTWIGSLGLVALLRRANRAYLAIPELPPAVPRRLPSVDVVIPARNEAARLPALLASLQRQTWRPTRIIVVDDGSIDPTAHVAEASGAEVVRLSGPPAGWTGKCFACQSGAEQSRAEWILFLDADVQLAPGAIAAALGTADRLGDVALSIFLRQRLVGFAERLLLPIAYQLYAMGYRPTGRVANGQFLLVRSSAYRQIGGHGAVRGSVIEDVAIAEKLAAAGRVRLLRGERWGDVRMYEDLPGIAEGFGKNAARFLARDPIGGAATAVGSTLAATVPLALVLGFAQRNRTMALAGLVGIVVGVVSIGPWLRRAGLPMRWALLQPFSAAIFQLIALRSLGAALGLFPTTWKGRRLG